MTNNVSVTARDEFLAWINRKIKHYKTAYEECKEEYGKEEAEQYKEHARILESVLFYYNSFIDKENRTMSKKTVCDVCNGNGWYRSFDSHSDVLEQHQCEYCHGSGYIEKSEIAKQSANIDNDELPF